MLDQLIEWDKEALIFLNSYHTPWLDPVIFMITNTLFWLPLYAFLVFLIFKNFKTEAWFILIGVAITILLSDQITSTLMKPFFARLRPSHDPSMAGLLHHVNGYKGGLYGFSSGHSANTLGVAMFLWLTLRAVYKWIALIFLWAMLVAYTRIYLGVHFPGDILVGGTIGLLCGYLSYQISQRLRKMYHNKKTPSIS